MKLKRILAVVMVAVLAYFGSSAILDKLQARELKKTFGEGYSFDDNAVSTNEHEHLILLVGVDKNSDSDNNDDFTRTDTIMLMKANTETGKIDILSIPRDSRVKIREEFDKVNHAHAFGGIELTMQTLRNFLGLDIDYYVQVNYKAVENIIDALGGVDFDVPEGVSIDVGRLKIREGMNHFDGQHALWYLRTRKIYVNGDIGRVKAQQGFVKAMVDQIVDKSKKINLMTFITNYLKYVKTNLPMPIMMDLANNVKVFSSDKVSTYMVPGHEQTIYATSYYIPDFEKTLKLVDRHFKDFKLKNWDKSKAGFEKEHEENTGSLKPNPPVENQAPANPPSYNSNPNNETYYYYEPEPEHQYYEPSYENTEDTSKQEPQEDSKPSEPAPEAPQESTVEKADTSDIDE